MKRFKIGLQLKAMVLVCVIMLTATAITVRYFSERTRQLISSHSFARLDAIMHAFTFDAEYGLLVRDQNALDRLVKGVEAQKDIVSAFVLDKEGQLLSKPPSRIPADATAKIATRVIQNFQGDQKNEYLFYEQLIPSLGNLNVLADGIYSERSNIEELSLFEESSGEKERIGYGVIVHSPAGINREMREVGREILLTNITLTTIIVGFLFLLTVFLVRGLIYLRMAMQKIAQGELATRVSIKTKDELEELAEGFNHMAEALEGTTVSRDALVKEIAERKRLENVVLQSEKMAAVGQLAGGVAHEINNPLGVILGFAQSVVRRIPPGDPYEMPLKSIEREAIRCKNLVQDLLTFSRVSKTEKEEIDLNESIEGALSLVLAQSKVKKVTLEKEFAPDLPKPWANKNQIQQIIVNLSNNAMDAMPEGGALTIRTRKASLRQEDAVEIQVQDTGQGIPKEIQAKIFEPFFTTKEVGKGTGLGLSLVFEVVQRHQGEISVDSEVGKGTLFTVLLPVKLAGA